MFTLVLLTGKAKFSKRATGGHEEDFRLIL
jgi:hypothetical protein